MTPQECARMLGNYQGTQWEMITMRDFFRAHHQQVADIGFDEYNDALCRWRLWYMKVPNDPKGDIVWQEPLEGTEREKLCK